MLALGCQTVVKLLMIYTGDSRASLYITTPREDGECNECQPVEIRPECQ